MRTGVKTGVPRPPDCIDQAELRGLRSIGPSCWLHIAGERSLFVSACTIAAQAVDTEDLISIMRSCPSRDGQRWSRADNASVPTRTLHIASSEVPTAAANVRLFSALLPVDRQLVLDWQTMSTSTSSWAPPNLAMSARDAGRGGKS